MKQKIKALSLTLICLFLLDTGNAQSLQFYYTDGTTASYDLSLIRKMTFNADVLDLILNDGSVLSTNLSVIDRYEYQPGISALPEEKPETTKWELTLYPNPLKDELHISCFLKNDEELIIECLNMNGQKLHDIYKGKQKQGAHDFLLDMQNYPGGTYLIRMSSGSFSLSRPIYIIN